MRDQAQPVEGQDQTAQTDDVQAGASQAQGGAPWDSALSSRFEDEGVRQAVSEFLREDVQPYVTRLEQNRNEEAERLYAELNDRPGDTYLAITEELFGGDAAQAVQDALLGSFGVDDTQVFDGDDTDDDEPGDGDDETKQTPSLDPRLERMVQAFEQTEQQKAYASELARVKAVAEKDGVKVVDELISPFVVAADGDLATAYQGYKKFVGEWKQAFGEAPSAADVEAAAPPPEAPPALGSDATGTTTPPVTQKYQNLDDALDAFFDETKNMPPAPVGSG